MLRLSFSLHLFAQGINLVKCWLVCCLRWCLNFLRDGSLIHPIAVRAKQNADEDNDEVTESADIADRCQQRILGLALKHIRRAAHLQPCAVRWF